MLNYMVMLHETDEKFKSQSSMILTPNECRNQTKTIYVIEGGTPNCSDVCENEGAHDNK
jgi:hypothetical protein